MTYKYKTSAEVLRDFGYAFTVRRGERMGRYTVISCANNRLTLRCDCGETRTTRINTWKWHDLNVCHCGTISQRTYNKPANPCEALCVRAVDLTRYAAKRAEKLGYDGPLATPAEVLAHVGPKPPQTDLRSPELNIRDGLPPTAENYYWKWTFLPCVITEVMAKSGIKNRIWLTQKLAAMTDDEIREARAKGIRRKHAAAQGMNGYEKFIGQKFNTLEVTGVTARDSGGVTYYIFSCRCTRCGRSVTRRAFLLITGRYDGCPKCGYNHAKKWRNSAVARANKFARRAFRNVENPGVDLIELMRSWTGEYTAIQGSPAFIEAYIDATLLGKADTWNNRFFMPNGGLTVKKGA